VFIFKVEGYAFLANIICIYNMFISWKISRGRFAVDSKNYSFRDYSGIRVFVIMVVFSAFSESENC